MRPHFAKSYLETYKIYDHMQTIRSISQKITEILRFEYLEITRICCTFTPPLKADMGFFVVHGADTLDYVLSAYY